MRKLLSRWFIDGMSFMALGLFSSRIIGLILKTVGQYIGIFSTLTEIGELAMSLAGAAIGVAIAVGLKSPPLIIFSSVIVGHAAYPPSKSTAYHFFISNCWACSILRRWRCWCIRDDDCSNRNR